MCFGINNSDGAWLCLGPGLSAIAFDELTYFRNEKRAFLIMTDEKDAKGDNIWKPDPNFVPQTGCELFARRVVAEIGFALLPLVIVVECVVRMAIGLVAALPCFLVGFICQNNDLAWAGVGMFVLSGAGLLDLPLRCLVALVKNVTDNRFWFHELKQCEIVNCE